MSNPANLHGRLWATDLERRQISPSYCYIVMRPLPSSPRKTSASLPNGQDDDTIQASFPKCKVNSSGLHQTWRWYLNLTLDDIESHCKGDIFFFTFLLTFLLIQGESGFVATASLTLPNPAESPFMTKSRHCRCSALTGNCV